MKYTANKFNSNKRKSPNNNGGSKSDNPALQSTLDDILIFYFPHYVNEVYSSVGKSPNNNGGKICSSSTPRPSLIEGNISVPPNLKSLEENMVISPKSPNNSGGCLELNTEYPSSSDSWTPGLHNLDFLIMVYDGISEESPNNNRGKITSSSIPPNSLFEGAISFPPNLKSLEDTGVISPESPNNSIDVIDSIPLTLSPCAIELLSVHPNLQSLDEFNSSDVKLNHPPLLSTSEYFASLVPSGIKFNKSTLDHFNALVIELYKHMMCGLFGDLYSSSFKNLHVNSKLKRNTSDHFIKKFKKYIVPDDNTGLIQSDKRYSPNNKSLGYRLNVDYFISNSINIGELEEAIEIEKNNAINKKFRRQINQNRDFINVLEIDCSYLISYFSSNLNVRLITYAEEDYIFCLQEFIDQPNCILKNDDVIGEYYNYGKKKTKHTSFENLINSVRSMRRISNTIILVIDKNNRPHIIAEPARFKKIVQEAVTEKYKLQLFRFMKKEMLLPTVSSSNGRLFSLLTSFPKVLLRGVHFDQNKIMSYDLKTSQVTILLNLMLKNRNLIYNLRENSKYSNQIKKYLEVFLALEIESSTEEIIEFIQKEVVEGDIYALIKYEINKLNVNEYHTRDLTKTLVLRSLYVDDSYPFAYKKLLEDKLPILFKNLSLIKLHFKQTFGESKSSLSTFLQLVEAHIFVEGVTLKLMNDFRTNQILFASKHDSILFLESESDELMITTVVDEYFNDIGFLGEMKVEVVTKKDERHLMTEKKNPISDSIFSGFVGGRV